MTQSGVAQLGPIRPNSGPRIRLLRKRLAAPGELREVPGVLVRSFALPNDVPLWLALRTRAFGDARPGVGPWTQRDFAREVADKPWWRPPRTWIAVDSENPQSVVGSVTLGERRHIPDVVATVHWLMVDPTRRRRGVGGVLLTELERAAWAEGYNEIWLETHAGWEAAVALYERFGYRNA